MDKDLFRIIIFAIGLAVIIGMIAWSYLKHEKAKQLYGDYDDNISPDSEREHSELGCDETEYDEEDDEDHHPSSGANAADAAENATNSAPFSAKKLQIIQFSIVAQDEDGFNGKQLFEVLDDVGLEYGNLQIFERLDARRLVDFGVASMVKPGIFPSTNLAAFSCPGIVFFMQPGKLENPVAVFDDFVRTFKFVASQLDGEMWDHHRELLTEETLAQIRHSLNN
jgi:cell division protein ZipA